MGRTTQHPLSCVTDYPEIVNKYEAHKLTFAYLKSYTTTQQCNFADCSKHDCSFYESNGSNITVTIPMYS